MGTDRARAIVPEEAPGTVAIAMAEWVVGAVCAALV